MGRSVRNVKKIGVRKEGMMGGYNKCSQCGYVFRTLDDEVGQHGCPSCGYFPHDEEEADEEEVEE